MTPPLWAPWATSPAVGPKRMRRPGSRHVIHVSRSCRYVTSDLAGCFRTQHPHGANSNGPSAGHPFAPWQRDGTSAGRHRATMRCGQPQPQQRGGYSQARRFGTRCPQQCVQRVRRQRLPRQPKMTQTGALQARPGQNKQPEQLLSPQPPRRCSAHCRGTHKKPPVTGGCI